MLKIVRGWKGICKALGYSERPIKKLHYEVLPIPFTKLSIPQQGRIEIEEGLLKAWYKDAMALRLELKNNKDISLPYINNLLNVKRLEHLHSDN